MEIALSQIIAGNGTPSEKYTLLKKMLFELRQMYSALSTDHIAYFRIDVSNYGKSPLDPNLDEKVLSFLASLEALADCYHRSIGDLLATNNLYVEPNELAKLEKAINNKFVMMLFPAAAAMTEEERRVFLTLNGIAPN